MNDHDARVSVGEVARLAGVEQPAVSNWRRRHADFPKADKVDGRELFDSSAVAKWLDGRKIPKNALKPGEVPGSTFGARYRANAGSPKLVDLRASDLGKDLWLELEGYRGLRDVAAFGDLVLCLLFIRSTDHPRWSDIVQAAMGSHQPMNLPALLSSALAAGKIDVPQSLRSAEVIASSAEETSQLVTLIHIIDRALPTSSAGGKEFEEFIPVVFSEILMRIANAEGKRGGEFFTPRSVVRIVVEMMAPQDGDAVYDPCCGTGNFLVGAADYLAAAGCDRSDLAISGETFAERPRGLATMSLAIRGVDAYIGQHAMSALRVGPPGTRRFDIIMTNPPFNAIVGDKNGAWREREWPYGTPPEHNANFAWLQHAISLLTPHGRAAVLMPTSAAISENRNERAIRAEMVEDGAVEAVVALPPQLFYSTAVPVHMWIVRPRPSHIDRSVLLIDATGLGALVGRGRRQLDDRDIEQIVTPYHQWRRRPDMWSEESSPISAAVAVEDIRARDYRLNPRMYTQTAAAVVSALRGISDIREIKHQLNDLHRRAIEIDALADLQLERILRGLVD